MCKRLCVHKGCGVVLLQCVLIISTGSFDLCHISPTAAAVIVVMQSGSWMISKTKMALNILTDKLNRLMANWSPTNIAYNLFFFPWLQIHTMKHSHSNSFYWTPLTQKFSAVLTLTIFQLSNMCKPEQKKKNYNSCMSMQVEYELSCSVLSELLWGQTHKWDTTSWASVFGIISCF